MHFKFSALSFSLFLLVFGDADFRFTAVSRVGC